MNDKVCAVTVLNNLSNFSPTPLPCFIGDLDRDGVFSVPGQISRRMSAEGSGLMREGSPFLQDRSGVSPIIFFENYMQSSIVGQI